MDRRGEPEYGLVPYLYIAFFFALLLYGLLTKTNAAESDSLYFTSATDMIQKVDSIEAVCDTSYGHRVASVITCDWFGRGFVETKANEFFLIITCRDLICVGVVQPLKWVEDWIYYGDTLSVGYYQGQMVVWWREVAR